jgi:hypothetical protein
MDDAELRALEAEIMGMEDENPGKKKESNTQEPIGKEEGRVTSR